MAQYGQLIQEFEPEKDILYQAFTLFFNNPLMVKTKNVENFSVYMSKTYCLLSNECRYLIAFVNKDEKPLHFKEKLETIKWVSFQTRTLADMHELPPHGYTPKRGGHLSAEINRTNNTPGYSTYTCDKFPIIVTLLHKKEGASEYQDKGSIIAALETYNTIITLKNE